MDDMSDEDFQNLYAWIDEIPLSRPKRNITRDFSDGVMTAELVKHFIPKLVELHNYTPANSTQQKLENWKTLNRKVLNKLDYKIPDDVLQKIAENKPHIVEYMLINLKAKIDRYLAQQEEENYDDLLQPHPVTTLYSPTDPSELYHQLEPHKHSVPLNSSKASTNPYPNYSMDNGDVSQEMVDSGRPSRLPVPISNNRHVSHGRRMLQYGTRNPSLTPTLPPIVPSLNGKKKGFSAPERSKHKKPSNNFWSARPEHNSASHRIEIAEKDQTIMETHETIQLLQMKVRRLEHLVQIKDLKIAELTKSLPKR